jgi:RNA polymerase sigma factor (sigma-70 family)
VTTALSNFDIVSDADLARAAATGDRSAFAMIYDRYADRLHDFCVGMLRDRDAAADCVQDVFCAAATQLPKLREPDRLRPWLYAIARNEALRCIRERRREQVSDELPEAASHDAGPDTLAARNELADLIADAAGGLGDRDRAVLELAYRHGLDGPELANALDVSPGSANKMVSRLRSTIESSLGALLVARRAQHTADACDELGAILAGWDGKFSVLMRKRISRHIESCSTCEEERRRLVSPAALLGAAPVFIPAPEWLRDHTLGQIKLTSAGGALDTSDSGGSHSESGSSASAPTAASPAAADGPEDEHYLGDAQQPRVRRVIPWIAMFAAAIFAALGLMFTFLYHQKTAIAPAELRRTAPAPMKPAAPPSVAPAVQLPPAPPANPIAPTPPIQAPAPVQLPAAPAPIPPAPPPVAPPPIVPPPPVLLPPPPVRLPPPIILPPPVRVTPPVYPPSPPVYPPPGHPTPPSAPPSVPPHRGPIPYPPPAGPTNQQPPPAQPPPPSHPNPPPPPPPPKGPVIQ